MSDGAPSPPSGLPGEAPPRPIAPETAGKRWRRRLRRAAIALFLLVAFVRIVGVAAAPSIVDKVLRGMGLTCSIGRLELSALTGELELAHVVVAPVEGGEPLVSLGYLRADVGVLALLRGHVVVRRLELDGLDVLVDRDQDGRLAIEKRLAAHVSSSSKVEEKKDDKAKAAGPEPRSDGSAPAVLIEALRVSHVHVRWRDKSVQPPLDAKLEVDLRVLDLALDALPSSRPARVELQVSCPPVLDSLRIEGEATPDGTAELAVALERLHLAPLAPYLEKARIRPYAKDISFGLGLNGRLQGTAAVFSLEHVALTADGHESLALDALGVEVREITKEKIDVERVILDGIRGDAAHLPDASIRVAGIELRAPKPLPEDEAAPAPADAKPEAPAANGAPAPRLVLDELVIRNVRAGFTDEGTRADLALVLEELSLRGLDARDPSHEATLRARLSAPDVIETITLEGRATPFAARPALHAELRGQKMTLRALGPYLAKAGLEPLLENGELRLTVAGEGRFGRPLEASVTLSDARILEGDRTLASIDAVKLLDLRIDPEENHVKVRGIRVERPRLAPVERDRSGALVVCGIRMKPPAPGEPAKAPPKPPAPAKPPRAPSGIVGKPLHLELGSLVVEGVQASFHDEAIAPATSVAVADAGVELGAVDLDLAPDSKKPAATLLRAWVRSPGAIERVAIDGSLIASVREPALTLGLDATGVTARAVAPYLAKAGVESRLSNGRLEVALRADATVDPAGPLAASFFVDRVRFTDGASEHLLLETLRIEGAKLDVKKLDRIEVGLVSLGRVRTSAATGPGGVLDAFGLHVTPVAKEDVEEAPAPPPVEKKSDEGPKPLLVLQKLRVGEVLLGLHEGSEEPAFDLPLRAELELGPFALDVSGKAPLQDAPFKVQLSAKGAIESIVLAGSLALSPRAARVGARLDTTGITAAALRARLATKSVEPLLEAGAFHLGLDAIASFEEDALLASLHVKDVVYEDRQELAGIQAIDVNGVRLAKGRLDVREVSVIRPRASGARDAQGAIVAGGFKISPPTRATAGSTAVSGKPAVDTEAPPVEKASGTKPKKPGEPFVLAVESITLKDSTHGWSDATVVPAVSLTTVTSVRAEKFFIGDDAAPAASLSVTFAAPGALEKGSLAGTFFVRPKEIGAKLALDFTGVRGDKVAGYLAPARAQLEKGALHADLDAHLDIREGSVGVALLVDKILWRDGASELLRLDAVRVKAPELGAQHVTVEEVAVEGLATRIVKTPNGETRLLGLVLPPAPAPAAAPGSAGASAPAAAPKAPEHEAARKGPKAKPPLIALDKLHLNVKELSFHDRSQAGSVPVVVSDLHVTNPKPIRLLGADPASQPAIELRLATAVAPIASSIVVETRLAPFAMEPDFAVSLAIDGLRGAGLTRAAPALAEKLDGASLRDGRVRAGLTLELRTGRRDALDFSALSNAFGLDLLLKKIEVKDGANGPVLLGLDELHADVARIDSTGGVHVRALEIAKPAGWIQKEKGGLRVLDILLKTPPPAPADAAATASSAAPSAPATTAAVTTAAAPRTPKPEVRVDRISITDIAFTFADVSTETSMVIPLTGLDVNVSQLTTKATEERRAIRFDAVVKAGKTSLPKHAKKDAIPGTSALLDLLGDVANAVTGTEKKKLELEDRRAFQEIAVKAELALVPNLQGSIDASVEGLELSNFKGPAKEAGVTLEDGIFDLDAQLRWNAQGDLAVKTTATFTDLDISEPKDGFVRKILGLPAPLNLVTFVLRDEEGAIEIPLDVKLPAVPPETPPLEKVAILAPRLWLALTQALAEIAGRAVLHSPFRVLGTATDLGKGMLNMIPGSDVLNVFDSPKVAVEPVVLRFAPADPVLSSAELGRIAELVEKLKDDDKLVLSLRHSVGGGDLARERIAANPSARDRRDILARLGARRAELDRERLATLAEARAALAAGQGDEADRARSRARDLDSELATVERARDQVYELERDGAERQAERRTRAACVDLAKTRLELIRAAIAKDLPPEDAERVRVSRPRVEEASGVEGGTITVTLSQRKKR